MNAGEGVRLLVEALASDGEIVPAGTLGFVVGFQGNRLIVQVGDSEDGTKRTVTLEPWEARRRT